MEKNIETTAILLGIKPEQAKAVLDLLEEGNTVPFIARYRKEVTGGLDEEMIRKIDEDYKYRIALLKRKEDVARLIAAQDKMTPEIEAALAKAEKLSEVEDIYRPYQQKRKTRASEAKRKGLEPLASYLLSLPQEGDIINQAQNYLNDEVTTVEEALQGAKDIIAEMVSDNPSLRNGIRVSLRDSSYLVCKKKKNAVDEKEVYRLYYDRREKTKMVEAHRVMAMDRAEKENVITVSFEYDKGALKAQALRFMTENKQGITLDYVREAVEDGLERLAFPSLEREIRNDLSAIAQEKSIRVFSDNVENLLLQAPLKGRIVLGYDPGYAHGCKLAVIDATGKMLTVDKIFPFPYKGATPPQSAKKKLLELITRYHVEIVAIGNGTASRESEALVAEVIKENALNVAYTVVSEAGASVYSAGDIARKEFPELAVEERSAVSIGRRILDPLAELIKIDPESIGVGQYQHDLPRKELHERLDFAVSKIVNRVGADLNTCSPELLEHISGLNKTIAANIVNYRNENGLFKQRKELLKVAKLGPKAYEQAAGFLRIQNGKEALDATGIHPESYDAAKALWKDAGNKPLGSKELIDELNTLDKVKEADKLGLDEYTYADIVSAFKEPLRDYRDDYDAPMLRSDILDIKDLKLGDHLQGVVRNVVDFGAFVDIGLHEDGLIHRSKMGKGKNAIPFEIVEVGQIVETEVISIDAVREKVGLALR